MLYINGMDVYTFFLEWMPKALQYLENGAILSILNNVLFKRVGLMPTLKFCLISRKSRSKRRKVRTLGKKQDYENQTQHHILPILDKYQFELVDVEYVKEGGTWYLRAYIDKEGGITVDDCEMVAREMNVILDEEDYVEGTYIFEVSSPGLLRPLKKEKDYIRNLGRQIEIRTYRPVRHEKEFYGILKAYDEESVTITRDEGEDLVLKKSEIALIRQAFDF